MQFDNLLPILNGLSASVFAVNEQRQVLLINDAGRAIFGENLVGADFVQAVRNPKCLSAIARVLAGEDRAETIVRLQNPVRMTLKVVVTRLDLTQPGDGNVKSGAIISLEDVSHIYEAEQMRSAFVANVSHELRSPLTSLSGFIETLKGPAKNDDAARERFLTIMESEAARMNRLIGDLLSLSKVEADAHIRPSDKTDLRLLIAQVLKILEPLARQEQTSIRLSMPDSFNGIVPGDSDQLQQVLINLVENAIKYGGKNSTVSVSISDRRQAVGTRKSMVRIEVADTGPGIAADHIARLTERFYRVDKGRSREKGGTGLGLAIVKHIVARHRGKLQISSEIGKGSTFTVLLPR